ncbi:hypothetical protein Tco_0752505 [Tanacetum coccineum]|uniref:Uncharacterized protein n=1 Tax=Tanacetum coccineum TaxID=301880 RepID=A0ABQ4Z721_9ASTR
MLCKQSHWFSYAKRCASAPVCIDDNRSCMKDSVITAPKPLAGSYNQLDVWRLSAFVVKLRDMPEGVLVLSGLSRVWKSRTCDMILRDSSGNGMGRGILVYEFRLPFYCTHPTTADAVILAPTLEDLAATTPSTKVLAKAEV